MPTSTSDSNHLTHAYYELTTLELHFIPQHSPVTKDYLGAKHLFLPINTSSANLALHPQCGIVHKVVP